MDKNIYIKLVMTVLFVGWKTRNNLNEKTIYYQIFYTIKCVGRIFHFMERVMTNEYTSTYTH